MEIDRKKFNNAIRFIEFALEGATLKDTLFKKPGHKKGNAKYTEEIKRRTSGYRETWLITPLHFAIKELKGERYLIHKITRKQKTTDAAPARHGKNEKS